MWSVSRLTCMLVPAVLAAVVVVPRGQSAPQCTHCPASTTNSGTGSNVCQLGSFAISISTTGSNAVCTAACFPSTACTFNETVTYLNTCAANVTLTGVECGVPITAVPLAPGSGTAYTGSFNVRCNQTCTSQFTATGPTGNTANVSGIFVCGTCQ